MKYLFVLLLFSIFTIACSDNLGTGNENCNDKCSVENEKTCTENSVMLCRKDEKGCFILEKLEDCSGTCENGSCKPKDKTCNPSCENWQTCNNQSCETKIGKCANSNDCTDNKICVNHECTEQTVKTIKKHVVVGAGSKSSSASFKLKLNVGKTTTIKKLKSTNFKLGIGTSIIDKK